MKRVRLARLDMSQQLRSKAEYERRLARLQLRMLSIQQAFFHDRLRGVVVVEGWDAAGKGGMIRRLGEKLDPRGFKVWPISAPDPAEQARHYLYRFWTKLPEPGTLAVFDRSWYGRVLVERVQELAPRDVWRRAYREINEFERMLSADGVRIAKVFLHITPEEQLRRFAERLNDPYKRWKLTAADIRDHLRWEDYVVAAEDMFARTSTAHAPWHVVPGDRKWYARVASIERIADRLGRGLDLTPPRLDPGVERAALRLLGGVRKLDARKRTSPK